MGGVGRARRADRACLLTNPRGSRDRAPCVGRPPSPPRRPSRIPPRTFRRCRGPAPTYDSTSHSQELFRPFDRPADPGTERPGPAGGTIGRSGDAEAGSARRVESPGATTLGLVLTPQHPSRALGRRTASALSADPDVATRRVTCSDRSGAKPSRAPEQRSCRIQEGDDGAGARRAAATWPNSSADETAPNRGSPGRRGSQSPGAPLDPTCRIC